MAERRFELRAAALILASLAMLLATIMPALAAQAPDGSVPGDPPPTAQPGPAQVSPSDPTAATPAKPLAEPPAEAPVEPPAEPPVEPSVRPPAGVPGNCDHVAGEFLVGYVSEEAFSAAPRENVVETFDGILAQHLVFEDIKNIADPAARLSAEVAKRQELAAQPGVAYAEYNCIAEVNQAAAADEGASIPLPTKPASCGDCGRSVVEGARKIISEGFQGAGSKDAFDAALQAARTAGGEDNVAFAAELELVKEGSVEEQYADDTGSREGGSTDSDSETRNAGSDATAEDDTESSDSSDSDTDEAGSEAKSGAEKVSGSGGEEKAADTESGGDGDAPEGEGTSGDDAAAGAGEGEDTGVADASDARPVSGKNPAVSEEPDVVSAPRILALGAGGLLLAAGVFVGRRILGA